MKLFTERQKDKAEGDAGVDVRKWLIKLGKWLSIIKIEKKPIQPIQPIPPNPSNYLVICPYCGSTCTFTWANTDIRGYSEEVGCWVCKCKKTPLSAMACSGIGFRC